MNDAGDYLLAWSWEPLTLFFVGLLGLTYIRGLRGLKPLKVRVVTNWRAASFVAGLLLLLLALISPIDTLGGRLFAFHMAQHMLLTHVAVPLILLGAPVLPVVRGMGYGIRRLTVIKLARAPQVRFVFHILIHPLVGLAIFVAAIWAWHVPAAYAAAVTNDLAHIGQHASFITAATIFWWAIIDPTPIRGKLPYLGRLVIVVMALSLTFPLAAMLTFAAVPWYEPYIGQDPLWGIDAMTDQQIGGLIMWVGGIAPYFLAIAGLFIVAVRRDEEDTRRSRAAYYSNHPNRAPHGQTTT